MLGYSGITTAGRRVWQLSCSGSEESSQSVISWQNRGNNQQILLNQTEARNSLSEWLLLSTERRRDEAGGPAAGICRQSSGKMVWDPRQAGRAAAAASDCKLQQSRPPMWLVVSCIHCTAAWRRRGRKLQNLQMRHFPVIWRVVFTVHWAAVWNASLSH